MTNRYGDFRVRYQRPPASARKFPAPPSEFLLRYRDDGEARVAQPFKGITTDGAIAPGLFKIEKTGVLRQHHAEFDHSRAGHTH